CCRRGFLSFFVRTLRILGRIDTVLCDNCSDQNTEGDKRQSSCQQRQPFFRPFLNFLFLNQPIINFFFWPMVFYCGEILQQIFDGVTAPFVIRHFHLPLPWLLILCPRL